MKILGILFSNIILEIKDAIPPYVPSSKTKILR